MNRTDLKKLWVADQGDGTYTNPILYSDYSDPDVVRVGNDYFMISSSFSNTPAIPVLHSRDLVNWKVINYVMDNLPFARYEQPVHGCGVFAPSIRFHDGTCYVFVPFPDEGILMCKTDDPWGKWSAPVCVQKTAGWIDPCPFWDDDGKAYMVNAFAKSRIGFNSFLYLCPMAPDGSRILEDGKFIYDGHATQPVIEGPKLYKRNGYYYIFAPAGGVPQGWQTVLRSRNIYGPYEEKIVLHQGNTIINGPHQGAWIDTPGGEDWFIHFQDVGNAGRIVHLQPMRWENDWPVIGVNPIDGCGEPVLRYQKPALGANHPIETPEDSDFFDGERLGLQWQWNANHKDGWYALQDKRLVLYAQPAGENTPLCKLPNLLLQKWTAPDFQATALLRFDRLNVGDTAGMISFARRYTALVIQKTPEGLVLKQRTGSSPDGEEVCQTLAKLQADALYIRMQVKQETEVSFEISTDGESFQPVGCALETTPGHWVGVKMGLFALCQTGSTGGALEADYFVLEPRESR